MLEIDVEETDDQLISLLDKIDQNNEIVIKRQGKRVAKLIPEKQNEIFSLPSLSEFRSSIRMKGIPMSRTVVESRNEEHY